MWFKFSQTFLSAPFTYHIKERCGRHNGHAAAYILEAISLISRSIDYPVSRNCANSAIAWEVLIQDDILRPSEKGYSAREWLVENGLFADEPEIKPQKPQKRVALKRRVFTGQNTETRSEEKTEPSEAVSGQERKANMERLSSMVKRI